MSGKSTKLIGGILLLVAAVLLNVFGGFNYVVSLIIGIIGVALIVLSFTAGSEVDISDVESSETPEMPGTEEGSGSSTPDLDELDSDLPGKEEKSGPQSSPEESKAKSEVPTMGEEDKKE